MVREVEMYGVVKAWLENQGYEVRAEVGGCDIVATRGEDTVLVELKRTINIELLLQVVRRQQYRGGVYAAVLAPVRGGRPWRERVRLLRRLEVGVLVVYMDSALPRVELLFHPQPVKRRISKAATKTLLAEMAGRSKDLNVGGRNRGKVYTAYWEAALGVAAALDMLGASPPRKVRALGASPKAGTILYSNHYGWFDRDEKKSLYTLTEAGKRALVEHADMVVAIRERLLKHQNETAG